MKRKDSKGRILRNGESQRKDGRYVYKYSDILGKARFLYSWRLDPHDKIPDGKAADLSLREKEKQAQADIYNQVVPDGGGMNVRELVDKYLELKIDKAKITTRAQYKTVQNILAKDDFGGMRIDRVKKMDAMSWLISVQSGGRGASTVKTLRGVLRPAFEMALDNDLVRKNPFQFPVADVIVNPSARREALTPKQMRDFLNFVEGDTHFSKYYAALYILFNTGLRISEFCGLTAGDIDMQKRQIYVRRQLQRSSDMKLYIETPKTENGFRTVPMMDGVYDCFREILSAKRPPREPVIDGVTGFLFFDKNGSPMVAMHWEHYLQHIVSKYNRIYKVQMPKVTPHVCRHTFCSNMARRRMDPKVLQKIMGHYDISVTMDVYTHYGDDDVSAEVRRIEKNA